MNWLIQNWQGFAGGGFLTGLFTFLSKRKLNKADLLIKIENLYNDMLDKITKDREALILENNSFKDRLDKLQDQFNTIQLAYAKEVEQSQNWEKLHRQLSEKYSELEKKHNALEILYEKLKAEFEKYKKLSK